MVEEVLLFDEQANRIFLFVTTCFMWGVHQANIRAFYRTMYQIIPEQENDFLLLLGVVQCLTLPATAIFDKVSMPQIHFILDALLFGSAGAYMFLLSYKMNQNVDKFPAKLQPAIKFILMAAFGCVLLGALFGLTYYIYGTSTEAAFTQWLMVVYYLNFFGVISFTNKFYETVHEKKVLAAFYVKNQ